jgi:hypothetical protein
VQLLGWPTLRVEQTPTLSLRNRVTVLASGIEPKHDRILRVDQSFRLRSAMGHAARKFWNVGDEHLIFIAPRNDDLVPVRYSSFPARLYSFSSSMTRNHVVAFTFGVREHLVNLAELE